MTKTYRIQFPGAPELDFTVGEEHRAYGKVLDIVETKEVLTYDGDSYVSSFVCVVKVIFGGQEIVFQANNPLMVVYREIINEDKR